MSLTTPAQPHIQNHLASDHAVIGKVASPPQKESTSEEFHFWIHDGLLVERGQIVRTELDHDGRPIRFYAVVREVYRQGRLRSLAEARDRHDGDPRYEPPFDLPGVSFALATILRSVPEVACPPRDGANVTLGDAEDAAHAFRADEIETPLAVGLIKNGARTTVGPGHVDLDYVLGANGGHINVTGVAGRGTKSSFLLHMIDLLLREARRQQAARPSDPDRLKVVPLILNVKNFDLFHIDRPGRRFDPVEHAADWRALGIDDPAPFHGVRFLAPQQARGTNPVETGRTATDVRPYSYSLADVIERNLFQYLFAEDDVQEGNFGTLVLALEDWLTRERTAHDGQPELALREDGPQTFHDLLDRVAEWANGGEPLVGGSHHRMTVRKFERRLQRMILEGKGVLRRDDRHGVPLQITAGDTTAPTVIDLSSLARVPSLQRFVVATTMRQLVDERTGPRTVPGLVYVVALDELNRFAPRGGFDPVTRLVENVAAEMRSQGIILFGAQQQASMVSARVIENAGLRVLGRTGSLELSEKIWRFLSPAARSRATQLAPDEKLLIQDSFREPMLVKIPMPPYALRAQEAAPATTP